MHGEMAENICWLPATESPSAAITATIAQQISQYVIQGIQSLSRTHPRSSFRAARPESWRAACPSIRTSKADRAGVRWRSKHHSQCAMNRHQRVPKEAQPRHLWAVQPSNSSATSSELSKHYVPRHTGRNCDPALRRQHFRWHRSSSENETYSDTDDFPAISAVQQLPAPSSGPSNGHGERNIPSQRETTRLRESGVLLHRET